MQGEKQQKRLHPAAVPGGGEFLQRIRPGPDPVAVQDRDGASAQKRQGRLQAAASFQNRPGFVADGDAATCQMGFHLLGPVMRVHHRAGHTGAMPYVKGMIDQRAARDRDQRLRPVLGQRAHAGAEPGGEDH